MAEKRSPTNFIFKFEERARWVDDPPGIEALLTVAITEPPKRKPFVTLTGESWQEVCEQIALWIEGDCLSMEELRALSA